MTTTHSGFGSRVSESQGGKYTAVMAITTVNIVVIVTVVSVILLRSL